ncbi:hypothetical protein EGW08_002024, partial [Elysia chlorotica]
MLQNILMALTVGVFTFDVFSSAQQLTATRCSTMLRYGGFCQDMRQSCPTGTFEYPTFSNFLGCLRTDQICCARQADSGSLVNPAAPIVASPPQDCGVGGGLLQSRILGGRITGPCDWPFVVSIRGLIRGRTQLSYANTIHSCAGVLIANNWVLTSPFCVL